MVTVTPLRTVGLLKPAAPACVGALYLADLSVPDAVYQRLGLPVGPIFAEAGIVRVTWDTPVP